MEIELFNYKTIEGVINRLALTSVVLKAAALVFSAILIAGCFINADNSHFHVASAMIVIVWGLDAYYLKMERGFRELLTPAHRSELICLYQFKPIHVKLRDTMFSKTMVWYYVPLLVLTGVEFLLH